MNRGVVAVVACSAALALEADAGEWHDNAFLLARVDTSTLTCDEETGLCRVRVAVERSFVGFDGDQHATGAEFELWCGRDAKFINAKGRRRPARGALHNLENGALLVVVGKQLADQHVDAQTIRRAADGAYQLPSALAECGAPPWSPEAVEACRQSIGGDSVAARWDGRITGRTRCVRGARVPCAIEAARDGAEEPVAFPRGAKLHDPSGKTKGPYQLVPGTKVSFTGRFVLPALEHGEGAVCLRDGCFPVFVVERVRVK